MAAQAPHIAFMNISATGHVNPTLAIVAELRRRGCQVTYFVDEDLRSFVEAAGASWRPFRPGNLRNKMDVAGLEKYVPEGTPPESYNSLPQLTARDAELNLPALLEDLVALSPQLTAIVSDPFITAGRVAAHVLQVPCIATLTMPGPVALAKPKEVEDAWEAQPWLNGPRQAMIDSYGFDIFAQGMPLESYSPVLNLVTTIDELFMPPAPGYQQERFGSFPFKMVGLLADPSLKRISNAYVDEEASVQEAEGAAVVSAVDEALSQGRRAIYISLGTVATSPHFYRTPFGHFGKENGLADCTGRQLAQHVFRCCIEAFGGRDDLIVALSLGPQDDVLEGLPPLPANFVARKSLPQLRLLQRCQAFLTHAGANSMHEALGNGVPMVVVPLFGDQPVNGDAIARCGAGVNFRRPLESVTTEALRETMDKLLFPNQDEEGRPNPYRESAAEMAGKIAAAGGATAAVDEILKAVQSWKVPDQDDAPPTLLGSRAQVKEASRETSSPEARGQPEMVKAS